MLIKNSSFGNFIRHGEEARFADGLHNPYGLGILRAGVSDRGSGKDNGSGIGLEGNKTARKRFGLWENVIFL
ncbi:hypothetical protein CGZ60_02540 [Neisseria animalis]|nr:hypothetical protein CGZ60_02540 [Neisseria animalis]